MLLEGGADFADNVVDIPVSHLKEHALCVEVVEGQKTVGQLGKTLGLVKDNADIVVVHLGRDRPVLHGFQKAPDGGQGRAEVMRDIGDEFLLVILGGGDGPGHVTQRGRKIAHFIVAFHIKFIMHISRCVLLCRGNDLSEGTVDDFREEDQDDDGQKQNNNEHQIRDVQHVVGIFIDLGDSPLSCNC